MAAPITAKGSPSRGRRGEPRTERRCHADPQAAGQHGSEEHRVGRGQVLGRGRVHRGQANAGPNPPVIHQQQRCGHPEGRWDGQEQGELPVDLGLGLSRGIVDSGAVVMTTT
jgi:hypothetical protein